MQDKFLQMSGPAVKQYIRQGTYYCKFIKMLLLYIPNANLSNDQADVKQVCEVPIERPHQAPVVNKCLKAACLVSPSIWLLLIDGNWYMV